MYNIHYSSPMKSLEGVKVGGVCLVRSVETENLYLCEVERISKPSLLYIKLLNSEYIRYKKEGGRSSPYWIRDFHGSNLYIFDSNDIQYWKGK